MSNSIVYAVVGAGLLVIFAGCVLLVTLALYGVVRLWWRTSHIRECVRLYALNKMDFLTWKRDFRKWEERKRKMDERCRECEYRRRYLEGEKDE